MTFIDTPGHEAFTQMRARGAKIADVAILVIAGDDGFKPQTEEALKLIQDAKLPYIVAITKVDKPDAQIERVKKELAEHEVLVEGYGGTIPVVGVSAKEQTGIHELLESVLLLGDLEQDLLKVNPDRDAVGTIIESHVDPQQGPIASVLVQTGTLKIGDPVVVGQVWGKIRSMKNDRGEVIKVARPSMPAQILGLKAAPQVGDILRVSEAESTELKKKVKSHQMGHHLQSVVGRRPTVIKKKGEDEEEEKKPELRKHLIILKTDTLGSSEAILESIKKFEHQEVSVEIVQRGLGIVTETDVLRAEAAKATIYAFHVPVSPKAEQLARSKNLVIRSYKVIYDLLDEIKLQLEALLPELQEVKEIGRLKVLAVFRNENTFQVVGGKVISGEIQLNANVSVTRKSQEIAKGTITQLQVNKQNVQRAAEGNECGMKVEGQTVIQVGDELVASIIEVQKRTLTP